MPLVTPSNFMNLAFGLLNVGELDPEAPMLQPALRPLSPPPPFDEGGQTQPRWTNNDSTYTLHDEVLASQTPLNRVRTQSENTEVLDIHRPQSQYLERPLSQYEQLSRPQSQYEQQEFGYALTRDPSRAESFVSQNSFATAPGSPER